MTVTVLVIDSCPNAAVFEQRLAEALADHPAVMVTRHVIDGEEQAVRWNMTGSPTILIDGSDPFARPGARPAFACRMYPGPDGRPGPAPSVEALRKALAPHSDSRPKL